MKGVLIGVFLVICASAVYAAVGDGSCVGKLDGCGATINSLIGHGAVELCGDCYVCGAADGVCPEDFYNGSQWGNCSSCADPDCLSNLSGKVYPVGDISLGINDVQVTAQVLNNPDWQTEYTTTTATIEGVIGSYWMMVPRGDYKVAAEKFGYNTHLVQFPLYQGDNLDDYTLDISLADGSCNADCTGFAYENGLSYCRAECEGYEDVDGNTCTYPRGVIGPITGDSYNIAAICNNKLIGDTVILESDATHSFVVDCCAQIPSLVERPSIELQQGEIDNLIQESLLLEMEGEASLVKVKIVVYE